MTRREDQSGVKQEKFLPATDGELTAAEFAKRMPGLFSFVITIRISSTKGAVMKKVNLKGMAIAVATVFGMALVTPAATAADVSKETKQRAEKEYKAAVNHAEADYKAAKKRCDGMKGNEKDVCVKE